MEFCTWSTERQEGGENWRDCGVDSSDKSAKSVIDRHKLRRRIWQEINDQIKQMIYFSIALFFQFYVNMLIK